MGRLTPQKGKELFKEDLTGFARATDILCRIASSVRDFRMSRSRHSPAQPEMFGAMGLDGLEKCGS